MLGEMGRHGDQLLCQASTLRLNTGNFLPGKSGKFND